MHLACHCPVPAPNCLHGRHRPLVLVRNDAVDRRLKVREQRKPDAGPDAVGLTQHAVVCERVIVEEEAGGDVERYEHVDGVVLVRRKDEEDRKHVENPAERVQQRSSTRSVCSRHMITKHCICYCSRYTMALVTTAKACLLFNSLKITSATTVE